MRPALPAAASIFLVASAVLTFGATAPAEPQSIRLPAVLAAPPADPVAPWHELLSSWRRPAGPVRIALQAGHWRAAEAPAEQAGLRNNGTRGGGRAEWEVNLDIASRAARILQDSGYAVEILPTTIPPGYWADLFISVHADGHSSSRISGYRAAAPRRDLTGRAEDFADLLDRVYGEETGLPYHGVVTRRMRGYYAFNHRRYEHALHPMTPGVILETGFLSSPRDRRILLDDPDRAARGIARAVTQFISPVPPVTQPQMSRVLDVPPPRTPATPRGDQAR